ncbi:hypothetical protein [Mesorhizobium sp. M0239]|uniref:hypothetical protein n=1 Tax=Mesorhizobium sp. M0239 TaxID=2956924 RepID=UPI0033392177
MQYDEVAEAINAHARATSQIEADEAKLQALESRIEAIQNVAEAVDPREMALAGCVVSIAHGGTLQVTLGLVKAEDRKALAVLESGNEGNDQEDGGDDAGRGKTLRSRPPACQRPSLNPRPSQRRKFNLMRK